ncbi:general substrate transporter [Xylogone sp. PMI_703]|nr:general substrate transporter [Xylogone sp. PMI_703]
MSETPANADTDAHQHHALHYQGLLLKDILPKRKHWWNYWFMWRLNMSLLCALLANAVNGYDGSVLSGLQSLPTWTNYFNHPKGAALGVLGVGINIGGSVAMLMAGFMCDFFGRRIPLGVGCVIIIVGAIVGAAANSYGMFLGGRILVGFGNGLCAIAAPMLLAEVAHPSQRAQVMSMYAPTYPLGGVIAGWTTFATFRYATQWSWRLPMALQGVFSVIQLFGVFFIPESPRWLVAVGKRQKAVDILVKHHGDGDPDSALVKFELSEIESSLEADSLRRSYSWMEFFKTKGNRRRLYIMLFFPWARQFTSTNLISYFFPIVLSTAGITNNKMQLELNAGMNMVAFAFAITTNFYVEKVGRRVAMILPMFLCALCVTIWTILMSQIVESGYTRPSLGYGVVVVVYLFQGIIHIFDATCEPYVQEISTFELRAKITIIWNFGQQVVEYVSSFANPVAMASLNWKYLLLYVVLCYFYAVIMYIFFPETKGLSLEECAMIFDGDEAKQRQHALEVAYVQSQKGGGEVEHVEHLDKGAIGA